MIRHLAMMFARWRSRHCKSMADHYYNRLASMIVYTTKKQMVDELESALCQEYAHLYREYSAKARYWDAFLERRIAA